MLVFATVLMAGGLTLIQSMAASRAASLQTIAVDLAADGEDGLSLALANPYDLLIVDIMLPKLDGLTVCRRLRAAGNHVPVLLMTARNTVEDKVSGFDMGADQFLTKPFAFAELLARVRALLRRSSPQPSRPCSSPRTARPR